MSAHNSLALSFQLLVEPHCLSYRLILKGLILKKQLYNIKIMFRPQQSEAQSSKYYQCEQVSSWANTCVTFLYHNVFSEICNTAHNTCKIINIQTH